MKTQKQVAVRFGWYAAIIITVMIFTTVPMLNESMDFEKVKYVGMAGMVLSLSMIFFAIRRVRDGLQQGYITFVEGFRTGLIVALFLSMAYLVSWLSYFEFIDNSFIDKYTDYQIALIESGTGTAADKTAQVAALKAQMIDYRKFPNMIVYALLEIFPFGFIVTLLCAVLMKRKMPDAA